MQPLGDTLRPALPLEVQDHRAPSSALSTSPTTGSSPPAASEPNAELVAYRQLLADPEGVPHRRTDAQAEHARCQYCYGVGKVVNHRLRPGQPGFGQAIPCTACSTSAEQHVARLFRQSVPPRFTDATFASYPPSPITAPLAAAVQSWALDPSRPSLLLAGSYGVGKTGLAICALRERTATTHCEALFLTTAELLDRLRETYNRTAGEPGERESEVMEAVKSVALLVLDDLGAERVTDWVEEKLFALINHRHNFELATIFTTNLKEGELKTHIGPRIGQRIGEQSLVLRFPDDAPNLRTRKEATP